MASGILVLHAFCHSEDVAAEPDLALQTDSSRSAECSPVLTRPEGECRFAALGGLVTVSGSGDARLEREGEETVGFRIPLNDQEQLSRLSFLIVDGDLMLLYEASGSERRSGVVRYSGRDLARVWQTALPTFDLSPAVLDGSSLRVEGQGFEGRLDTAEGFLLTVTSQETEGYRGDFALMMSWYQALFDCWDGDGSSLLERLSSHVSAHGYPVVAARAVPPEEERPEIERRIAERFPSRWMFEDGPVGPTIWVFVRNLADLGDDLVTDPIYEVDPAGEPIRSWPGIGFNSSDPIAVEGDTIYFEERLTGCLKAPSRSYWIGVDTQGRLSFRWPIQESKPPVLVSCPPVVPRELESSDFLRCQQFSDPSSESEGRLILSQGPMT